MVHEPEMLILDEPTSGVDPLARDRFWELLIDLSRNQGVTIFVSTHFMNEAARCDRISLMHAGRVLATGTPGGPVAARGASDPRGCLHPLPGGGRGRRGETPAPLTRASSRDRRAAPRRRAGGGVQLPALFAYAHPRSTGVVARSGPAGLRAAGHRVPDGGLRLRHLTDVDHLSFAVLDRDQTPESIDYLEEFRGSIYFTERRRSPCADLEHRLASGERSHGNSARIWPRRQSRGAPRWAPGWTAPCRSGPRPSAAICRPAPALSRRPRASKTAPPAAAPDDIEMRFRYNQDFDSIYAMVPGTMALLLVLFPAILMALAIVREKELGSITNLYVTPVTRIEFLLGKQLPYIAIAMVNFMLLA